MAHAAYPRRLLDDDDVIVEVADHEAIGRGGFGAMHRLREECDDFSFLQPAGRIGAEDLIDEYEAILDERADVVPRRLGLVHPRAEDLGERMADFGGDHGEGGKDGRIHFFNTYMTN